MEATVEYVLRRPDLKDKFLEYLNGIVGREAKNASVHLAVFGVGGGKFDDNCNWVLQLRKHTIDITEVSIKGDACYE